MRAGIILSSMLYRFSRGTAYNVIFYIFTRFVLLFCALEPLLVRELRELDERVDLETPSPLRVLARPIAY